MTINKKPMKIIQFGQAAYTQAQQQQLIQKQNAQKVMKITQLVPPNQSNSNIMFNLVKNLAVKMPRSLFPKNTLVRLYPTGVFEVQGFSPMAFIITSASFVDHLTHQQDADTKLFNPKSFSFQIQFPSPPKNKYFEITDSRLKDVNIERIIYHLSCIYFCRFHPTYPVVDPTHYFEKLDSYFNHKPDLSQNTWTAFHFLAHVICMIAGPMTQGFAHLHHYFEDCVLDLVPKMYKIPHIYTCQGMFLLRCLQMSGRRASSKWMRYSDFAMRMCNSLGVFRGSPPSFKNDPSLVRSRLMLATIAQYTDLNVTSSTNTLPQLNSDMISLGIFSLPATHPIFYYDCCNQPRNEKVCPFNSLQSLSHVITHDTLAARSMLQLTRFYYMAYVFNTTVIVHQLDNIKYLAQIFHQATNLSSKIKLFYSTLPRQLGTKVLDSTSWYHACYGPTPMLSKSQQLSLSAHVPIFMKLPAKEMRFTIYLHCWYYFISTTLYDKVSQYENVWTRYLNCIPNHDCVPEEYSIFDVREECAHQNARTAIRLIQIFMLMGDEFYQYFISLKYLFITRASLTLARLLIGYNRKILQLQPKKQIYFSKVTKFSLPRFYYDSKHEKPYDPYTVLQYDGNLHSCLITPNLIIDALKYGLYILYTSSEKWFIARESFNLLIGLLNQNDIKVVT
jgi:hypothetical protein